jgi:manganese transport protein
MKKALEIFLGVMTALGGFVDIGELVFTAQAGATFRYSLLWAIALGTIGIIVYSEMSGRIAAVAKQPVFEVIKLKAGTRLGLVVLVASMLVNLATCAAEIGGIAILLRLLTGYGPAWLPLAAAAALIGIVWTLPFKWEERLFGIAGLTMLVFFIAAVSVGPDWSVAAPSLLPNLPPFHTTREPILYAYFVVGILSSLMMPYEVYFYSSGGIEEGWKRSDIQMNRGISIVGFSLGSLVAMAIMVLGAEIFASRGVDPDTIGSAALLVGEPYGRIGIILALVGMLTAVAGAAVETALAGANNFAQYFGYAWGRSRPARQTPMFDAAWIGMFVLAASIMLTGVDPILVVELSVMLAVVCLPFTYLPILLAASDPELMGKDRNGPVANVLGWLFFVIICVAALAAPILLIATGMGSY